MVVYDDSSPEKAVDMFAETIFHFKGTESDEGDIVASMLKIGDWQAANDGGVVGIDGARWTCAGVILGSMYLFSFWLPLACVVCKEFYERLHVDVVLGEYVRSSRVFATSLVAAVDRVVDRADAAGSEPLCLRHAGHVVRCVLVILLKVLVFVSTDARGLAAVADCGTTKLLQRLQSKYILTSPMRLDVEEDACVQAERDEAKGAEQQQQDVISDERRRDDAEHVHVEDDPTKSSNARGVSPDEEHDANAAGPDNGNCVESGPAPAERAEPAAPIDGTRSSWDMPPSVSINAEFLSRVVEEGTAHHGVFHIPYTATGIVLICETLLGLLARGGFLWTPDKMHNTCTSCGRQFHFIVRKHHCRHCGRILCKRCSRWEARFPILGYNTMPVRACSECFLVGKSVTIALRDIERAYGLVPTPGL